MLLREKEAAVARQDFEEAARVKASIQIVENVAQSVRQIEKQKLYQLKNGLPTADTDIQLANVLQLISVFEV